MLALGLSIFLLVFWGALGYATLSLLHRQNSPLHNALIAPAVGMAATLLPVFWLNRAGIPVGNFGIPLTIALAATTATILWKLRPKFPWKDFLPFAAVLLIALLLTGRPLLEFGFDWVSYGNQDLTYYVASADRFLHHGYLAEPGPAMAQGKDYTLNVYGMIYDGHRTGSDLLLAWVSSITGLAVTKALMPLIMAFLLAMISAAGALVYISSHSYWQALLVCGLVAASALNSLGAIYQLLAQVSGITLMVCLVAMMSGCFTPASTAIVIRRSVLAGLLTAALLIAYPEAAPFLGLTLILYTVVGVWRQKIPTKLLTTVFAVSILSAVLATNLYLAGVWNYFRSETSSKVLKAVDPNEIIFPHYLVPKGLAGLWGLQPINAVLPEPWSSLAIAAGGLLLVTVLVGGSWLVWHGQATATTTIAMLGFGILLFFIRNDFGIFKLAMFVQPFMISTFVLVLIHGFANQKRSRFFIIALLSALGFINLHTQNYYVEISRGYISGGFVEIPRASPFRLYTKLENLMASIPSDNLIVDTPNVSLGGVQYLYTKGKRTVFPGFTTLRNRDKIVLKSGDTFENFDLHDRPQQSTQNEFIRADSQLMKTITAEKDAFLIAAPPQMELFNRWFHQSGDDSVEPHFRSQPLQKTRNHLVFIPSSLGKHYFLDLAAGSSAEASFYQLEPDYFVPDGTMAGIGRHFLFQVFNPSEQVRFVLEMTASLKSDGENQLPPPAAIGESRQPFPMVGRGSARVFSPTLTPQVIRDRTYASIDMGVNGKTFPTVKTGLMRLYGNDIPTDNRKLVGFARDISLISEQDYLNLTPPASISQFPGDLMNHQLEYSGVYEDGWVSEAAFFGLAQPAPSTPLVVRGTVPAIGDSTFSTELKVLVDGQELARRTLQPGEFNLRLPVSGQGRHRVDLRFSQWQNLPDPDKRPVAVKLAFLGFSNETN